jgi:thiopurine S-methyltransferase
MSGKHWKQAWEDNQIDFHQSQTNALLMAYLPQLRLPADATVFVPLCGKSRDMAWLLSQNLRVAGIELSPIAVAAFFDDNQLQPQLSVAGRLTRWHCDRVDIFCGDFFDLQRADLGEVAAVYDRAALLALGPLMRRRYVRHMSAIVPWQIPILLLTTEYPDVADVALPAAVAEEILALYEKRFSIELLHTGHSFETHPGQGHTELQATEEKAHLLRAYGPLGGAPKIAF